MAELKPCPFCGGDATLYTRFWIVCMTCGAQTTIFDSAQAAVEAWNRRAGEEEQDG